MRNSYRLVFLVSHTTHDLVFKWNITDPLVTNPDIELPQLDIAKNSTEDCTLEYSTGKKHQTRISSKNSIRFTVFVQICFDDG